MPLAPQSEAVKEYARNYGEEHQDKEWVSTPWDTWEKNPFYTGKPGRHPEDDHYGEDDAIPQDRAEPVEPCGPIDPDGIPF